MNDAFLDGPGVHSLQKVWSDEAREAAAEARARNAAGKQPDSSNSGTSSPEVREAGRKKMHAGLTHYGWTNTPGGPGEPDVYSNFGQKGVLFHVNTGDNSWRATYQGNEVASGHGDKELLGALSGAARTSGDLRNPPRTGWEGPTEKPQDRMGWAGPHKL